MYAKEVGVGNPREKRTFALPVVQYSDTPGMQMLNLFSRDSRDTRRFLDNHP